MSTQVRGSVLYAEKASATMACGEREDAMSETARPHARETAPEADPFGGNGDAPAVCSCGAPQHAKLPDRCAGGHVIRGNALALIHGERSLQTREQDLELAEQVAASILADRGYDDPEDAPTALVVAASTLARAAVAEARTFERVGDLAGDRREHRAHQKWMALVDKVYAGLRVVGLDSIDVPKEVQR